MTHKFRWGGWKALLRYHVFGRHTAGFLCVWCETVDRPRSALVDFERRLGAAHLKLPEGAHIHGCWTCGEPSFACVCADLLQAYYCERCDEREHRLFLTRVPLRPRTRDDA